MSTTPDTHETTSEHLTHLAEGCNVVLLFPTSHVARYIAILHGDDAEVLGYYDGRKGESLIFVAALNPTEFLVTLSTIKYVCRMTKKAFLFSNKRMVRSSCHVAREALQLLESARDDGIEREMVVRISAFPPRNTSELASEITELIQQNGSFDRPIILRPTLPSHILSSIQLQEEIFMISVELASQEYGGWNQANTDDISRAYHKLEEAFCRYSKKRALKKALGGSIALDCGASPGGWTKYLAEEINCRMVYSVDPAELSGDVLNMEQVCHIQTRIDKALHTLLQDGVQIGLWVSDMCLYHMSDQLDWLLEARANGLLSEGSFFVLTLKCVRGHSTSAFDRQVDEQVKRLDGIATEVEVFHLFSNRIAERTVMGIISLRVNE